MVSAMYILGFISLILAPFTGVTLVSAAAFLLLGIFLLNQAGKGCV